mgnify:CR=1 FL=1
MFGKLLKNELKAQWHSMSAIFFAIIVIAVAGELLALFSSSQMGKVLGGLAVIAVLFFACVFILIAVGMMYNKTMFGRAGYLTLTLPVKTNKLIWAKTASGLIWTYLVYFLFLGSCFLWFYQVKELMGEEALASAETILSLFGVPSFKMIAVVCIFFAVSLAISALMIVQSIFLGITLSNVKPFSKLGLIGTIIFAFVIFYCIQSVSNIISEVLPMGMVVSPQIITFTSDTALTAATLGKGVIKINFAGPLFRLLAGILLSIPVSHLTKTAVNIK